MTEAIITIRNTLPDGWDIVEITWETVPHGWKGEPTCVFIRCEDTLLRFPHPEGFSYHPFYKLWFLQLKRKKRTVLYLTPNRKHFVAGFALGQIANRIRHQNRKRHPQRKIGRECIEGKHHNLLVFIFPNPAFRG